VELTLSGHTHYGQIAIPRLGWSLASPFLEHAMGRHQRNGSQLYINPGTNYWGIPFRLGTPPEVTVLTLRRGDGRASLREPSRPGRPLPEVMPSHP
jgi:predicted MPP superfamily phosphohydrolase